ncbi:hypothetical protein [Adhaeribacter aquaticus]|uniref:hypothetical protein n=1 Tax=Adhaeribacter aquaticus TaxID=299567 RepID=UPI0003F54F22|nr:hypothetical protein [Adhaeribacter aquaticus]
MLHTIFKNGQVNLNAILIFNKTRRWSALLLTLLLLGAGRLPDTKLEPITLQPTTVNFTPKEFYIASIIDERQNRKAVGYLVPLTTNLAQAASASPVDLQGGGLNAIKQFVNQSLPRNSKLRPITIRLKECKITETPGTTGRVDGQVVVAMAFYYTRIDGKTIKLEEYRGGARYSRIPTQHTVVEPALRQSLVEALRYLHTWMDREANRNDKLAKGIKVNITDFTYNTDNDTVFYTVKRPLNWSDFQASPRANQFAAAVFPSFAYEGGSDVENGIIQVNLKMKVYVLKSSSWVRAPAKDDYTLNHEQRHFDIVKIIAERFKRKVQPDSLNLEDYNSIIQYKYIESFREMNKLQDKYDGETQHGTNHMAQEVWNNRIDADLKKYGIK